MNITESLIRIIEKDGIILKDRVDVFRSIDLAIEEGRFSFVNRNGRNIGFFTWEFFTPREIFINNLFIERQYRGKFSLMPDMKLLRNKYKGLGAITWRSRKKNKLIRFEKRMELCCSQY